MKEVSNVKKGLSFGFSTVNNGQRQVVHEPQLIATSTEGGFRITPIISKVLGIEAGDYVMFVSNVDNIDAAIRANDPEIVAYCEENGLEPQSPEAIVAIHSAFDMWGIAKGIKEFDAKGNPKMTTERLTKKDRARYVTNNFDTMLKAAMESGDEELVAALSREGITAEEQIDILCPFVQARELPKYRGSKTANPAGLTGVGVTLNFTDNNIWSQLKVNLGEEATKLNRIYDINIKEIVDSVTSNGYEEVPVKVLVLGSYEDKAPARIGAKEDAE